MSKVCPTCSQTYADAQVFCPTDGTALRATDVASSFVGSIVADRYLVTELLGEGGMGKVYLARHVKLPRQAAIKVLHAGMVQDADAIARFNREATNASRIDHDRVARVFDFGETSDGLVYLAMEYVEGRTLKRVLAEDGPMSIARTARVVRQIAEGLDAAHRLGIVHRDLKPDNILVARDDRGADRCKVVDFGIAKAIGSGERSLTRTGFVVGTPEYMSPEQLLGQDIDHRCDVYALALVAFQCLTGETAFNSNTPDRGLIARLTSEPRALDVVRPDKTWPEELQASFNKGLARDRDQRHRSALAFADAFDLGAAAPHAKRKVAPKAEPEIAPKAEPKAESKSKPDKKSKGKADAAPVPPHAPYVAPLSTPYPGGYPVGAPMYAPSPASSPTIPKARRWRLPRLPIVRWAGTIFLLWFGYLVFTEGSLRRAVRRATSVARSVESDARRMVGGSRPAAVRQSPASVAPASNSPSGSSLPDSTAQNDGASATGEPPSASTTSPPAETMRTPAPGARPPATPPVAAPPVAAPPDTLAQSDTPNR